MSAARPVLILVPSIAAWKEATVSQLISCSENYHRAGNRDHGHLKRVDFWDEMK